MCNYNSILVLVITIITIAQYTRTVSAIECYQCVSTDPRNPFLCNEFMDNEDSATLKSCDNVYGAQHCIKHVGRFEAHGIKCYQCDSAQNIDCTDVLINEPGNELQSRECEDVFEAQYCVKSIALRGGIGTQRYCSSHDLGNYCNYVQHKGDKFEYRSCVYTCNTDGCNSSSALGPLTLAALLSIVIMPVFLVA